MVLYTSPGGADIIEEEIEKTAGFYRIYAGKKVMRILRGKYPRRSHRGLWYKLLRKEPYFFDGIVPKLRKTGTRYYKDTAITKADIESFFNNKLYGQKELHP